MIIRLVTLILVLVTAMGNAPVAAAQKSTASGDWASVIAQPPGTKLSVKIKTGETIQGNVSSVSSSRLSLLRGSSIVDLERDKISKVHRVGGGQVGKSTVIGLGVGTAAGVAIGGVVAATDGPTESGEGHLPILVIGTAGAIIGTATGALTGLFRRKKVLIYQSN